jgi:hypothetical protein
MVPVSNTVFSGISIIPSAQTTELMTSEPCFGYKLAIGISDE